MEQQRGTKALPPPGGVTESVWGWELLSCSPPAVSECSGSPLSAVSPLCLRRTRTPTRATRAAPWTRGRTMSPSRPTTSSSPATPPGSTTTGERAAAGDSGWFYLLINQPQS